MESCRWFLEGGKKYYFCDCGKHESVTLEMLFDDYWQLKVKLEVVSKNLERRDKEVAWGLERNERQSKQLEVKDKENAKLSARLEELMGLLIDAIQYLTPFTKIYEEIEDVLDTNGSENEVD